ncbi:hypothetical protein Tco_0231816 [Tanacetum coccineum]
MLKELKKRIAEEQTVKENMSIEEMRHEQQLVDRKIKEIINDLDSNEWGSKVQKKEQAYEEEKYSAAHRYMLSIPFVDEDDYIPLGDIIARYSTSKAITPDLLIEEPDNSLSMGDEHLDTTLSIENLVPIPCEFEVNRSYCSNFTGIVERFDPNDESSSDAMIVRTSTIIRRRTRSGSTTTHANYSLTEYDSFHFEIKPDQEGLISIDNSNNTLLELPEFESFHFDPSFPHPPPKPPDVEICLNLESDTPVIDNFNELNDDQRGSEIDFSQNVEDDDSFTFSIRTFLPFITYPEVSLLSCSTGSEDTIFDPGISTQSRWNLIGMELSCALMFIQTLMKARLRFSFPFASPWTN